MSRQIEIRKGSRVVIGTEQNGRISARLYVDNGEVATHSAWQGKTEKGLRAWASRVLS